MRIPLVSTPPRARQPLFSLFVAASCLWLSSAALAEEAAGEGDADADAGAVSTDAKGGEQADGDEQKKKKAAVNPLVGPGGGASGVVPYPLHAFLSTTQSLGQGTFVRGKADNPMVATSVSLTPYLNYKGWWVMLNQSFNYEWTESDTNTLLHQVTLSDTVLQARYWGLAISDVGLRFPVTFRVDLPTSLASRWSGMATALGATLAFQWMTPINVMFTGGINGQYRVIVPEWAQGGATDPGKPYEDRFMGTTTPQGCLVRSPVEAANFACGGIPRIGNIGANLGFNWFAAEQIMVTARAGIASGFAYYWSPDDEFTSGNARAGLGHSQNTTGSLGVSYSPFPWLWLTASADTFQPLFQADGQKYRWFPFWDLYSPANNFSTLSFDTTLVF